MSKVTKRTDVQADLAQQEAKKSKTMTPTTPAPKVKEFCKNFVEIEEKEMESRTGEEDLKLFKTTCGEIHNIMTDILNMKIQGKMDDKMKQEMMEKRIEASLLFVTLKKLNRLDKLRLKKARDMTHDAKQRVDTFHLQLENLLYEVFHLRKEVDKCLEFKSKDEDIELVPVEEFYQEAPTNISKPEVTKNNQHKLTLARLEWEFEQRKRLSEQCRNLEHNKEKATNDISQKQKQLESLLPKLNAILEVTRPLQEELNLPVEKIKFQKELAALLPDPLYILYCQVKAFIEACDQSMQVTIEGGMEEAMNFGSKFKSGLDEILEDVDSAESDLETDYETNKRATTSNKIKNDLQFNRHPLRVQLKIDRILVTFSYLSTFNVITVDCKSAVPDEKTSSGHLCTMDNFLSGLFPNDHGEEWPNWVNYFQGKPLNNTLGKPFQWAQQLAGLDFIGPVKAAPTSSTNTNRVGEIVRSLKSRINHRFELEKVLILLEKGELNLNSDSNAAFPAAIVSRLVSWISIAPEDCLKAYKHCEQLLTFMEISPKNVMFFKAVIQRDTAKLNAIALIPVDYPDSNPIFSLELDWHGKHTRMDSEIIRNVEAEINVFCGNLPSPHKIDLLTVQLKNLSLHLDLITETDGQLMKKGSGSWQSQSQTKIEFPAEKMIPLLIKGHDRATPTKFDAATGFFLHR